jgi:undecaprenyl-diphosphatase
MFFLYFYFFLQIILEVFPISSSGHILLFLSLLKKFDLNLEYFENLWAIDFFLHGPTFFIILIYFFSSWWKIIVKKPINFEFLKDFKNLLEISKALLFIFIADFITFLFWVSNFSLNISVTIGFFITAILLVILPFAKKNIECNWKIKDAFLLGLIQGFSLSPGISRFASTYVLGRFLGYKSELSFQISFLIQAPLIFCGFIKGMMKLSKSPEIFTKIFSIESLFVIFISTLISLIFLNFVNYIVKKEYMNYFALYMIVPIIISLLI